MPAPLDISISRVSAEHSYRGSLVATSTPRLSWRFAGSRRDWTQKAFNAKLVRRDGSGEHQCVETSASVLVAWPFSKPLESREIVQISIQSLGTDGSITEWSGTDVEAGILDGDEWADVRMIGCPPPDDIESPRRPFLVKTTFRIDSTASGRQARVYATAHGVYELEINGRRVGDQVLAPGWTVYEHRLAYQTYDIGHLLKAGNNTIQAWIGPGWYNGRLGFLGGKRNVHGSRNGLFAKVVIDGETVLTTDSRWEWAHGSIITSELYDGETCDMRVGESRDWQSVDVLPSPEGQLFAERSPVRRMETVKAKKIVRSPTGKTLVDFGQNLVGWLRLESHPPGQPGHVVAFTHAEVLENEELATRPLRLAKCRDEITLGDSSLVGWEPKFTYHGFRYVQVDGWELQLEDLVAVVIHTDMERLGHFESSHEQINQLHRNVIWGLRGNFVSIPTDCPQRDERLGWTGDVAVFARTAGFIYDTTDMLGSWLEDVAMEQLRDNDGIPSLVTPNCLRGHYPAIPTAIWGDVTILAPNDLYEDTGDIAVLEQQYESMSTWIDRGIVRGENGLWKEDGFQFGDWLAPDAHPDTPGECRTDPQLVANAYLLHVTRKMQGVCRALGKVKESERYARDYRQLRAAFANEFISPNGRPVSDSQTAIALALHFDLLEPGQRQVAIKRLDHLVRKNAFKVGTGFAGTPMILDVLAANDRLALAYRMLQGTQCPSWLYCVMQGATTMWERWDSLMPDGSVNPGEMVSYNHFSLGSVANFIHEAIGGIRSGGPGWKHVIIQPRPGGTLTNASVSHTSPYGRVACEWRIRGDKLLVQIAVPPNSTARVILPGVDETVASGERSYTVAWTADLTWPPQPISSTGVVPMVDEWI